MLSVTLLGLVRNIAVVRIHLKELLTVLKIKIICSLQLLYRVSKRAGSFLVVDDINKYYVRK
jgi:hypothetical protein